MSKNRAFSRVGALATVALGLYGCASPAPCGCAVGQETPRPPAPAPLTHEVRPGDTLGWIARGYGVRVAALARANGIGDVDRIHVGQRLRLPRGAGLVHVVRQGDTFSTVAALYDVPILTIAEYNDLRGDNLSPGQLLVLPSGAELPPAPPEPAPAAVQAHRVAADRKPPSSDSAVDSLEQIALAEELVSLATEAYLEAQFEGAIDRAREAQALLRTRPEGNALHARATFVAGSALAGLGRDEEAKAVFKQTRSIDPDFDPPPAWLSPRIRALYRAGSDS